MQIRSIHHGYHHRQAVAASSFLAQPALHQALRHRIHGRRHSRHGLLQNLVAYEEDGLLWVFAGDRR